MLSYRARYRWISGIGVVFFIGFWIYFIAIPRDSILPRQLSLIGIIMGALIFFFAVRRSPARYVPEVILAAEKNDTRYLRFLMKNENIPPGILSIALCEAVKNGAKRTMGILLKEGADPNYGGYAKSLYCAFQRYEKMAHSAKKQGLESIELLLKFGADPKLPVNSISKPFMLVAKAEKLGLSVK